MPPSKRERRFVSDSPASSRKSSLSQSDNISVPGIKRSPLAPLDPQVTTGLHPELLGQDIVAMSYSEEHLQSGRKASVLLTNANRPTPYNKRTSSRRPLPPTQGRRTSLSSLHLEGVINPSVTALSDPATVNYDDIYSDLNSYKFGDNRNALPFTGRPDNAESISPLQRVGSIDLTPRPSGSSQSRPRPPHTNGWSSLSEDEAEEKRRITRGKLRAIDDGARRPSLPTNDPQQEHSISPGKNDKGKGKAVTAENGEEVTHEELDEVMRDVDPIISDRSSVRTFGGGPRDDTGSVEDLVWDSDDREGVHEEYDDARDTAANGVVDYEERRGSQPVNIPQPRYSASNSYVDPVGLDMHMIAQMRRPSRSLDDDISRLSLQRQASRGSEGLRPHGGIGGSLPASEPNMRGLALAHAQEDAMAQSIEEHLRETQREREAQGQPEAANESAYLGFDLDYIMAASNPSPTSNGRLGSYQFMPDWRRRSSGANGALGPGASRGSQGSFGFNRRTSAGLTGQRRTSVATVGTLSEDTFLSQLRKNDVGFQEQCVNWSFTRETAEGQGAGLGGGEKGGAEMWRSPWIGRFEVKRLLSRTTDPSKPRHVRLDVRHVRDPYLMNSNRGGPLAFVHQHLRAEAFSIFRAYNLPRRHLKTETSILLAPKRVQLQYTSTHSTSLLSTHGLLEDGSRERSGRGKERTEKEKREVKEKDRKGKSSARAGNGRVEGNGTGSQTSSGGSVGARSNITATTTATERIIHESDHRSKEPESRPSTASSQPLSSRISHIGSSSLSTLDNSILESSYSNTHSPQQSIAGRLPPASRAQGSIISLEDQPAPKTSHAEAFATLDPSSVEYHLAHVKSAYHSSQESHNPLRGFFKFFQAPPTKAAPKAGTPPVGRSPAMLEGHYRPPWVTMAMRREQEEQDRASKNLDESFSTVGLTPSPGKSNRVKEKRMKSWMRSDANPKVIDHVPDDSLYMLLPMWPGETDPGATFPFDDPAKYEIQPASRQYLLVFYKRSASRDKGDDKEKSKKAPRQSQTTSGSSHHTESGGTLKENKNTIALTSFDIGVRLVSHEDVHGTGIRVPTKGLSVAGPLQKAVETIPRVRFEADDLSLILGFCKRRELGVQFLPEAAEKIGLCMPRESPSDPEVLTPVGRAALEMAWLGALAVMGFGVSL